jgi:hypothetical protein
MGNTFVHHAMPMGCAVLAGHTSIVLAHVCETTRTGGVSNVDSDGDNAVESKAIGVALSPFETRLSVDLPFETRRLMP